jgi:Glu-tRNA(Gln) amidotransferase subunit E-like FAD-binding protein
MDQFLNQLYGTVPSAQTEEDAVIEKIAADLNAEGVDIDSLSDEEAEALLNAYTAEEGSEEAAEEVAEEGAEEEATEETEEATEEEKTAADEEFENSDKMGRIMAHAFVNELNAIEKTADAAPAAKPSYKDRLKALAGKAIPSTKKGKIIAGAGVAGAAGLGGYLMHRKRKGKK